MLERRFERSLDSLDGLFELVEEFLAAEGVDASHGFELELIAEELFTNQVRHAGGAQPIAVALGREGDRAVLVIRDPEVAPFAPDDAPDPGLDRPLAERRGGGMGLHLVRTLSDEMRQERVGRDTVITVKRRLGG